MNIHYHNYSIREGIQRNISSEEMLEICKKEIGAITKASPIDSYRETEISETKCTLVERGFIADKMVDYSPEMAESYSLTEVLHNSIPLVTYVTRNFYDDIVGPRMYLYPDGKLAAHEWYALQYGKVILQEDLSVWYSPDGKRIKMEEFDTLYQKQLSDIGIVNYAPRYEDYILLSNSFCNEIESGRMRRSWFITFREQIASWSDERLKLLETRIRQNASYRNISISRLDNLISSYLYGKVNYMELRDMIVLKVQHYLKYVDLSKCEIKSEGDIQHHHYSSVDSDKGIKYHETYEHGRLREAYFYTDHGGIGPSIEYYPNGDIAFYKFDIRDKCECHVVDLMCFDQNRLLSNPLLAHEAVHQSWKKEANRTMKRIEKKENFDKRAIAKTYKRFCTMAQSNMFAGLKIKGKK